MELLTFLQTEQAQVYLEHALFIISVVVITRIIFWIIEHGTRKLKNNVQTFKDDSISAPIRMITKFIKVFLYSMAAILIISNLGYNVNSLIAGLGLGGLAFAFAAQKILADLFSSFLIYFDKPFAIGDQIKFKTYEGRVKTIGLRSSRITLNDQAGELIVPNKVLSETEIVNQETGN